MTLLAFNLINHIKAYADSVPTSESMEPEQNVFYATLFEIFSGIHWERAPVIPHTKPKSPDKIWIQRNFKLFVKLDSGAWRSKKSKPVVPYAEECAWRVAEFLKWPVVPKTVVIHESQVDDPDFVYYKPFMHCFMNDGVVRNCPVTFTFQTFVEGAMLPHKYEEWTAWMQKPHKFSLPSYQMAYLFGWLVGKGDAHSFNTLHNSKTGNFYEVDNEVIGLFTYDGVLHRFASYKSELICTNVLQSISSASGSELQHLLDSYNPKNRFLRDLWSKEVFPPNSTHLAHFSQHCSQIPSGTVQRLRVMQKLRYAPDHNITLLSMEKQLERLYRKKICVYLPDEYIFQKSEHEAFHRSRDGDSSDDYDSSSS